MGTGCKGKVNFFMDFLKHLVYSHLKFPKSFACLAVLDYLPKLRMVMRLVVSADFLHAFFIKVSLINIK